MLDPRICNKLRVFHQLAAMLDCDPAFADWTVDEVKTSDIGDAPWSAYQWDENVSSIDGAPTDLFVEDDVESVISYGSEGDRWDGESACIVLLKDGRYAGWESSYGPTGSGFVHDAYGGDAEVMFSHDLEKLLSHFSERARDIMDRAACQRVHKP